MKNLTHLFIALIALASLSSIVGQTTMEEMGRETAPMHTLRRARSSVDDKVQKAIIKTKISDALDRLDELRKTREQVKKAAHAAKHYYKQSKSYEPGTYGPTASKYASASQRSRIARINKKIHDLKNQIARLKANLN